MILALDLSTKATGWAIYHEWPSGENHWGFGTLSPPDKRQGLGLRYAFIMQRLLEMIEKGGVVEIYAEQLHSSRNMNTVRALAGLHGALLYEAAQLGIPVYYVNQKTAYKQLGIKGKATKDKVVAKVRALGYDVKNDNEADAIAVLLAGMKGEVE